MLIPLAIALGRWLAVRSFAARRSSRRLLALPLVLPPTVLGFYLLVAFGSGLGLGQVMSDSRSASTLVFTFEGLLLASVIVNIPFAVQPMQRAFEAVAPDLREAAARCGISWWRMRAAD